MCLPLFTRRTDTHVRNVPAEVRTLSTTPLLFAPTTVERFICRHTSQQPGLSARLGAPSKVLEGTHKAGTTLVQWRQSVVFPQMAGLQAHRPGRGARVDA